MSDGKVTRIAWERLPSGSRVARNGSRSVVISEPKVDAWSPRYYAMTVWDNKKYILSKSFSFYTSYEELNEWVLKILEMDLDELKGLDTTPANFRL